MHTTTVKIFGHEVFVREWGASEGVKNNEAVILLHGIESHSEWFSGIATSLSLSGYGVFGYDRDGWGRSAQRHSNITSYSAILKELTALTAALRVNHKRIHLVGLSWGGMFALYAGLRRKIFFDSLSMIAPGVYPHSKFTLKEKSKIAGSILLRKDEQKVTLPINIEDFTSDKEKAEFIKNDKYRNTEITASTAFETLKMQSFCNQNTAKRRLLPTALLLGEHDRIIDNKKTRKLFKSQAITVEEFSRKRHSLIFEDQQGVADVLLNNFRKAEQQKKAGKVLIMGAGAVGSMVGAMLALSGHEVTLVGRKKHVDKINSDGLTLILGGISRTGIKENLRGVESVAGLEKEDYSLVILAVKSFDTVGALEELEPVVRPETVLMSLQNGISNESIIKNAYPENTILAGAICAYLNFVEAGVVSWSDDKGGIAAGVYHGSEEAAEEAVEILQDSGLEIKYHKNRAINIKWSKMLLNIAFNALNAVTGLATSEILADKKYGNLAVDALKEGFAVMKKEGIRPVDLPGYSVTALNRLSQAPNFIVRKVLAKITDNETDTVSSMQQDITRGKNRGTEIAELNGKIVEIGERHGVEVKANEKLCALLNSKAGGE